VNSLPWGTYAGMANQTFTATSTGVFTLSYDSFAGGTGTFETYYSYNVRVNDGSSDIISLQLNEGPSNLAGRTDYHTFNAIAGNSYDLSFAARVTGVGTSLSHGGVYIDDVKITQGVVPEPGAALLSILGAAVLGLRRRRADD